MFSLELAAKTITDKTAANSHDRLSNAQDQAERLARQQHDLSVQRLQDVAAASDAANPGSLKTLRIPAASGPGATGVSNPAPVWLSSF